ncbi:MAG: hypothetical protein A3F25_02390 [Candidatus Yanofskybacteria bacterium RIFCSPHIGHO2_12_FULL_45_19b]|uniref:D-lactate dehydrogenase (cytochrome) n=2 Tax=Candidatus Yanofskyibacteriota TaxID=1752733 RepID=A0A1F8G3C7_9BACT|nr:MAG: hypothetical protein A3F25_02390 [Candidatus Yanofskybacteria bacterium RIFCSPHIGHO2_12_FULL_45_19b]
MNLREEIEVFFTGEVDDSPATLENYSRDASLFYVKPALVVFPKNTEAIRRLVVFVNQARANGRNLSLTARAAGTDMSGGPLTESIVVEMTRHFNRIKKIGNNYAVVEPGVYYRDFEVVTLRHNLLMPSYPASRELCTVGGMVANNSGGEKTLRYGKTEKYVTALKMILQDGNEYSFKKLTVDELKAKLALETFEGKLYKDLFSLIQQNATALVAARPDVTKNSSGYSLWDVFDPSTGTFDITRLIVGSQGTFGIITEITFSLVPPELASRILVIFLNELTDLSGLTSEVLKYQPESFESYDSNTFRLAIKFFPEIIKRIRGNIFRIALSFMPEFWMLLTGGIPKLVLLMEFAGQDTVEAENKAQAAYAGLRKVFNLNMHITKNDIETAKLRVIRRESFNLLRQHIRGLRTAPFIDDFAVNPKYLPEFLERLYKLLGKYPLIYTLAGHVGDGNLHIIPLLDLIKPESKAIIIKLSQEVYALVLSYNGTITAEHNDGIIRTPFLEQAFGKAVYDLFVVTKKIFDPLNIFNPGKKVGGSMRYLESHIQTS